MIDNRTCAASSFEGVTNKAKGPARSVPETWNHLYRWILIKKLQIKRSLNTKKPPWNKTFPKHSVFRPLRTILLYFIKFKY